MPTVIGAVLHAMRLLWTCKPSRHGINSARTSASNGTTCACRANVLRRNRTSLRVSPSRTAIIHAHLAQNLRTSRAITERTIMILFLLSSASHRSMQYAGVCTRSGVSAIEATSFDLRSHRLYLKVGCPFLHRSVRFRLSWVSAAKRENYRALSSSLPAALDPARQNRETGWQPLDSHRRNCGALAHLFVVRREGIPDLLAHNSWTSSAFIILHELLLQEIPLLCCPNQQTNESRTVRSARRAAGTNASM